MDNRDKQFIIQASIRLFPDLQALYLFGSRADGSNHRQSDVDIALLLPPETAKRAGFIGYSDLRFDLENNLHFTVDLVNLRLAPVVLRHEIIMTGKPIYIGSKYETDTLEMLTMSFYQKLNDERKDIVEEFVRTGRAYNL